MKNSQFNFPVYAQMVSNLFKIELPGHYADLLHAAIGVAGEAGEIRDADSRKNLLEELGDMRFYIEAGFQRMEIHGFTEESMFGPISMIEKGVKLTLGNHLDELSKVSSSCLDFTKKAWVYGNREPKAPELYVALTRASEILEFMAEMHGFTLEEIEYENQVKLIGQDGRYKSGHYSDAAALAREDKAAG